MSNGDVIRFRTVPPWRLLLTGLVLATAGIGVTLPIAALAGPTPENLWRPTAAPFWALTSAAAVPFCIGLSGSLLVAILIPVTVSRLFLPQYVSLEPDGVRIPSGLFGGSELVGFAGVGFACRANPDREKDTVLLVGHGDRVWQVSRDDLSRADYLALFGALGERLPDAFAADPPKGFRFPD